MDFLNTLLNTGGAGLGGVGILFALYTHFNSKLKERDLVQSERSKREALANADRDKRLEVAQLKNELHEQRLNIQGEFIDNLAHKLDRLTDNVNQLTGDVKVLASRRDNE